MNDVNVQRGDQLSCRSTQPIFGNCVNERKEQHLAHGIRKPEARFVYADFKGVIFYV